MANSIFAPISVPEFFEVSLKPLKNQDEVINSKTLYKTAEKLFEHAFSDLISEQKKIKKKKDRSAYTNFVREYCKEKKSPKVLRMAREEWEKMDEENKEIYKNLPYTSEVISSSKKEKKIKTGRCSFSIYVAYKTKKKIRSYESLGKKWKELTNEQKKPFFELSNLDRVRADFEKVAITRFELVLRLLNAGHSKLFKKHSSFSVFKDQLKESLIDRGFTKMPNLEIIARKKYFKIDKELRNQYKNIASTKNHENFEKIMKMVMEKVNINFGELFGVPDNNTISFDEDFDQFLGAEKFEI